MPRPRRDDGNPPVAIFSRAIAAPFNVARLRDGAEFFRVEVCEGRVILNLIEAEFPDTGDASCEAVLRPWAEDLAAALIVEGICDLAFGFTKQPRVSRPYAGIDMAGHLRRYGAKISGIIAAASDMVLDQMAGGAVLSLIFQPSGDSPLHASAILTPVDSIPLNLTSKTFVTDDVKVAFMDVYAADPAWWTHVDYFQLRLRIDKLSAHRKLELLRASTDYAETEPR
jgi:hypothetical protein